MFKTLNKRQIKIFIKILLFTKKLSKTKLKYLISKRWQTKYKK